MSLMVDQARRCRDQGQFAEAERLLREAIARSPQLAAAHLELGNLLKRSGRYREALVALKAAVRWAPQAAAAWLNCGVAQLELGEREAAIQSFRQALALEPDRPEAHNILGHALAQAGKTSLAAIHLEEALRIKPRYAAAHDNLGRLRKLQGRAAEAVEQHRAALDETAKLSTRSNLLYTLNLLNLPPDQIFAEHRRQAAEGWSGLSPDASEQSKLTESQGSRLRIGYVSPDFCHHAVAYFFEPVLENHDRSQYEIFCYSDVKVPDAVTARLRSRAEHWRDGSGLSDSALLAAIQADRIDVLVDLAGHTAGNRLGVFARRAAPVQVTWLGYPNTTGLDAMDYRITDEVADPAGTERWHSERLLRLHGPFSCYRPAEDSPAVGPSPALAAEGVVTFGCFNHIAKWNEPLIHLWAAVLQAVPRSRLLLKSRGLGDPETAAELRRQFESAGIAADRVELLSAELGVAQHLALYGRVDIALDSFPYAGATTTCEALWMGVPVITLAGQTHVSRVGASMLSAAEVASPVTHSSEEYVHQARTLAADLPKLGARRAEQRAIMAASPLCNGMVFTRELESALRRGWEEKVAGRLEAQLVA